MSETNKCPRIGFCSFYHIVKCDKMAVGCTSATVRNMVKAYCEDGYWGKGDGCKRKKMLDGERAPIDNMLPSGEFLLYDGHKYYIRCQNA